MFSIPCFVMADCESGIAAFEAEGHVIAAAQHIVKALGATKNLNDELRKILLDLDSHLSTMTAITKNEGGGFSVVEDQLKQAERKIMHWESNPSLVFDSGPADASEYLQAVDEIQLVLESLGELSLDGSGKRRELLNQAKCTLQIAMSRLEEELIHILVQYKQYFEPEYMSFRSCGEEVIYDESFVSVDDEPIEEKSRRDANGNDSMEYIVDLVHPHAIPHVKSIANAMFAANYAQEFCEAFIGGRKDALEEYLSILKMEKFSIEDVLKMEWTSLNREIRKWIQAMKIIIRVYLASEKRFCNQILAEFGSIHLVCFIEISKYSISCLLNFGEAVSMGSHRPEKLFRLLDMYEVLADLHLDVNGLFLGETGSFIRFRYRDLLRGLGDSARETFVEFGKAIASDASVYPFPGGGIHHLTRYVMNYLKTLAEYGDILNLLLKDQDVDDLSPVVWPDNGQDISSSTSCPMASHLRSITSTLVSNLEDKSKLYKDESLRHIFLMNNIHYMVQKVKASKLSVLFGDEWIRKHNAKFQQHATSYERSTWSTVLSFLMDGGKGNLKEKCRSFGMAFEEVYKCQTRWCIPDPELREDLQISTSQKVILAYRAFLGRNSTNLSDKYIKYTADDLGKLILDLFQGPTRSMRGWKPQ